MKYATEMGSAKMIYIPSSIKIGSAIQTLIRGIHRHAEHRQHTGCISLLSFFKNKDSMLKTEQFRTSKQYHSLTITLSPTLTTHTGLVTGSSQSPFL
jgi:hypothetical protein